MKSIIFNQHQVNHALKNKEGMFRVVCKRQPCINLTGDETDIEQANSGSFVFDNGIESFSFGKPKFQVGETIFVKETFVKDFDKEGNPMVKYKPDSDLERKWNPPLALPQWASRLTLRIKSVKIEKLQDISEEDAVKDGGVFKSDNYWHSTLHPTKQTYQCWTSAKEAFAKLWNSTHKKPKEKWEANPFVFCFSYEVVR